MLKKLVLFLLILFIIYFILIFKAPSVAEQIEKFHGITGFNNYVIMFKERFDQIVTDIPTKEEVVDTYDKAYSGAIDLKNNVVEGIDNTKGKIDSVRENLEGAQDKYNQVKGTYDEVKDKFGDVKNQINDVKDKISSVSGVINDVNNVIEAVTENGITNTGITN